MGKNDDSGPKSSAAKKVAKAARAGGGPQRKRQTPKSIVLALVLIVGVGSFLIWMSRDENVKASKVAPIVLDPAVVQGYNDDISERQEEIARIDVCIALIEVTDPTLSTTTTTTIPDTTTTTVVDATTTTLPAISNSEGPCEDLDVDNADLSGSLTKLNERKTQLANEITEIQAELNEYQAKTDWHAAFGMYICGFNADGTDGWLPDGQDLASNEDQGFANGKPDVYGIRSRGDSVIYIQPTRRASSGENAQLGIYTDYENIKISSDKIDITDYQVAAGGVLPERRVWTNGDLCPNGQAGKVQTFVSGPVPTGGDTTGLTWTPVSGNPKDIRLSDRQVIVVAFMPEGWTPAEFPPSTPTLDQLDGADGSEAGAAGATGATGAAGATGTPVG